MDIRPFKGWRFNASRDGDVTNFIAPPYDILSASDKVRLLAGNSDNIVAVDLPHVPPKEVGPDSAYVDAAGRLAAWQASGLLKQDAPPALYAYEQTYTWAGRTYTRKALLCGVRATEFGKDVIPHEQTFAGPKADRLKLTQCTHMQLSPIFGFYDDKDGAVTKKLFAGQCCPVLHGELAGVIERLWVIQDAKTIDEIHRLLRAVPVYIADGHHRYTTAMNYRDELVRTQNIGPDHEANFVMFALVASDDPGLLILPTHRIIRGLKDGFSIAHLAAATNAFSWQQVEADAASIEDADAFLKPYGAGAMAFVAAGGTDVWVARLSNPAAMAELEPKRVDAWRQLDVAILHRLIVDMALAPWKTEQTAIEYMPASATVAEACRSGASLGVLLQGTPLSAVQEIANAGEFMPHKSTYFYPKLATGMVLKPVE